MTYWGDYWPSYSGTWWQCWSGTVMVFIIIYYKFSCLCHYIIEGESVRAVISYNQPWILCKWSIADFLLKGYRLFYGSDSSLVLRLLHDSDYSWIKTFAWFRLFCGSDGLDYIVSSKTVLHFELGLFSSSYGSMITVLNIFNSSVQVDKGRRHNTKKFGENTQKTNSLKQSKLGLSCAKLFSA